MISPFGAVDIGILFKIVVTEFPTPEIVVIALPHLRCRIFGRGQHQQAHLGGCTSNIYSHQTNKKGLPYRSPSPAMHISAFTGNEKWIYPFRGSIDCAA
jgi:hypothetical protein